MEGERKASGSAAAIASIRPGRRQLSRPADKACCGISSAFTFGRRVYGSTLCAPRGGSAGDGCRAGRTIMRGQGRDRQWARRRRTGLRGQGRLAGSRSAAHGIVLDGGGCRASGIGHGGGLVLSRMGVTSPT